MEIPKLKLNQDLCGTCDMNSTLGSVVPLAMFLINTYMVRCAISATALSGSTHKKYFRSPILWGARAKSGWVQKAILTLPIWFQDRRRQSLALYSVWNGEAGLFHIKTSWRTSLGLQYVSNLLSSGGYCTLHKSQILPQIW